MDDKELTPLQRRIMVRLFCDALQGKAGTPKKMAGNLYLDEKGISQALIKMEKLGLVKGNRREFSLTKKGRSRIDVVLAGGVFDIIHPGHIYTLLASKALGDALIVSVARDKTVMRFKRKLPMNEEKIRAEMVGSLKFVDLALLGSEKDIFETVHLVNPDIIALGYDQAHNEGDLVKKAESHGMRIKVVRLDSPIPEMKTSNIMKEL